MQHARPGIQLTLAPALILAVLCLCGCTSAGYKKSNAAARSLHTAAAAIESESQQIDATVRELNNLVINPATDLREQFKRYDKAVDRLYDSIEDTENAVNRSQRKAETYFRAWNKQLGAMNYEAVQTRGETRRNAVSNQLETITQKYRETREAVLPLLAYLEDIRKVLGTDLTAGGLEAVKDVVTNATAGAEKVEAALAQSVADFTTSSGQMSSEFVGNSEAPGAARQMPPATNETANRQE